MIINVILAVAVTISNSIILVVFLTNKKLQNSQAIFKISLAFSDLMVGVIVFPSMIINILITDTWKKEFISIQNTTSKGNSSFTDQTLIDQVRNTSIRLCWKFPSSYINAIGFFTVLSIGVLMCTLVAAACDRFAVVHKPLKYRRPAAINIVKKMVITWIALLVLALIPVFVTSVQYSMEYTTIAVPKGYAGTVVFSVVFTLLLVVMWITTIATFKVYQNYQKSTKQLQSSVYGKHEAESQSRNMLVILGIMVGAFTFSVLPTIIFLPLSYLTFPATPEAKLLHFTQEILKFVSANVIVVTFLSANSLWNFFIYSARDEAFRKACKHLFGRIL